MVYSFVHSLSGLIVLENATPLDGLLSSVMFDGQVSLGFRHVLTSIFCYYNFSNDHFLDFGQQRICSNGICPCSMSGHVWAQAHLPIKLL